MRFHFSSTLDSPSGIGSPEMEEHIARVRERAAHEMMPLAMASEILAGIGVFVILLGRVPVVWLTAWFVARLVVSLCRLVYSMRFLAGEHIHEARPLRRFRMGVLIDALLWSSLGWGLTPLFNLEVAVVTVSVLVGVSALGAFTLHVDMKATSLFIVSVMLPNALYTAMRQDDLGWFALLAIGGMMALLLVEARRINRRIVELLRLRFQSEQLARAQADALAQARSLSEMKSRFVATMSHEMRTPLHGILGLARLVRRRARDPESCRQLDLLKGSGEHLVRVIDDVLDFSKMEAGTLPLHEQSFDLHGLMADVAETWAVSCADKGLRLEAVLDIAPGEQVTGDPVRVRQVLYNLIGNAVKFTPAGFVRLRVARAGQGAMVSFQVEDSGIGIAADELPKVFEAFHQAEGTYRRRFGGTGLGLTISRELCLAMGGDLHCHSRLGEGTVFDFTLPLPVETAGLVLAGDAEAEAADAGMAWWAGLEGDARPHVLLVEDSDVNALVAEAELARLGVRVTVCVHGRQAVDWLEHGQTDLVLMDCEMPEMDGIEATRHVRARERATGRPAVGIVAMTANGPEVYAERCVAAGMDGHLLKPFRPEELAATLARHLRRRATAGASPGQAPRPMGQPCVA